jgi:hypothetical protein
MLKMDFADIVLVIWNHSSGDDLTVDRNGNGDERTGCGGRVRGRYVKATINLFGGFQNANFLPLRSTTTERK